MTWHISVSGRSSKLAEMIKEKFVTTGGCPKGSAEEAVKNKLGEIAESLCKSLDNNTVVTINANGSAWNMPDGTANSQACKFEFSSHGDFIE